MPDTALLPALRRPWDALERQRDALLARLAGRHESQLCFRPGPHAWSSRDVVEHLVLVEELVASRLGSARGTTSWRGRVALQVMRLASAMGAKVRVPVPAITPSGDDPLPRLAERWIDARSRLRDHLLQLDASSLAAPLLRHPVAGPLSAPQGLEFLALHLGHHRRQVERIQASPGFPRA